LVGGWLAGAGLLPGQAPLVIFCRFGQHQTCSVPIKHCLAPLTKVPRQSRPGPPSVLSQSPSVVVAVDLVQLAAPVHLSTVTSWSALLQHHW
jgi:hypothetical protein